MNEKDHYPHILNTSSNMLGLCFIVFTSINVLKLGAATIIDELTAGAIVLFMVSCILSFISMRSRKQFSDQFEMIADFIFVSGLGLIFVISILLFFNVIR